MTQAHDGASTILVNPADESVIGEVAHTPLDEVDAAVARAVVAQRAWASLAPADRAAALRRFAATVRCVSVSQSCRFDSNCSCDSVR